MMSRSARGPGLPAMLLAGALLLAARPALATEIQFRSFSASAAIGPPADAFAAKLLEISRTVLGAAGEVSFVKLPGIPPIPPQFGGDIVAAVAAGAANGGFDAAYSSGSELNRAWGFIYNSGVPFGPSFDEFLGFLYGRSIDGQQTALELAQAIMDARQRNVVVLPIVGSPDQLSGYFPEPIGHARFRRGIGVEGLCERRWTLRYLPPGEDVLRRACNDLLESGEIDEVRLRFIAAVPGGGSLISALRDGIIQGLEFATPLDDVSQLFTTADNPGTLGVRYVHLPGWQQQFLITWMIINRPVWDGLTPAQQALVKTVARDHVVSSYGENMRQQGDALSFILNVNRFDRDPRNDLVLVEWPKRDQKILSAATIRFLNDRANDAALPAADRQDYVTILEALRKYVRSNNLYWTDRAVRPELKFDGWTNAHGKGWDARR